MSRELRVGTYVCRCGEKHESNDGTIAAPSIAGQNERARALRPAKSNPTPFEEFVPEGETTKDRAARLAAASAVASGSQPPAFLSADKFKK
jgi:hypothetical protein